jgi:hypothetical protein
VFDAGDLQHLQAPAALEIARPSGPVARPEAVEAGVRPVVLGQVDVPRAGVDRSRLVGHEAHVLDRHGTGGTPMRRRHLEDEAVIAGAHLRPAQADFLAREPGAPRRGPAGAVDDRPPERGPRPSERAIRKREGGRAATQAFDQSRGSERVVDGRLARSHQRQRFTREGGTPFVVADEHQFRAPATAAARRDHGHAVVAVGRRRAIVHRVATPAERLVTETPRQPQQRQSGRAILGWEQRAVSPLGAWARAGRLLELEADQRPRQRRGPDRGSARAQERPSGHTGLGGRASGHRQVPLPAGQRRSRRDAARPS